MERSNNTNLSLLMTGVDDAEGRLALKLAVADSSNFKQIFCFFTDTRSVTGQYLNVLYMKG